MSKRAPCRVSDTVLTQYRPLYERLRGGFLLPRGYPGHEHAWVQLDTGYCVCSLCGEEHICFRGECPVTDTEACESVCTVTGCVVSTSEMRAEWGAMDRVGIHHHCHQGKGAPLCSRGGNMELVEFVDMVVREILDSSKTQACLDEERQRDHSRRVSSLAKILREEAHHLMMSSVTPTTTTRSHVNLVEVEAKLAWTCRKCRAHSLRHNPAVVVERVVRSCVDGICTLLRTHGWQRVSRQLQHPTRGREFVCSMLYLMRVGITFKDRCLLQKIDALHALLPLQAFLPTVFGIRAKSITEGENIIKLDIRKMPL